MTPELSTHARRCLAILPALVAFGLLAWKLDFLCDDAFISFRYSQHFAAGEGLRYNLTLGAPVEGYSNFLWVVWLALFEKLNVDVTLVARLSSALCGVLLVYLVTRRAALAFGLGAFGTLASGLFLASLPPVALWATGGLATMPAALFVFATYDALLGDPRRPRGWQAGAFAGLAALVRADGAVWIFMLLGAGAVVWLLAGRRRELGRALLQTALLLVLVVGAHVAWRFSYYGDWLPNTARVKAGFSLHRLARGADYVAAWLLTVPAVSLVLLASLRRWRKGLVHLWLPAGAVLAGTLAYAVWVGGDFMPMGRFLFPAVPFAALLFAGTWARLVPAGQEVAPLPAALALALIAISVLGCFDLNLVPASVRSHFHFRQDRKVWESELSMRNSMLGREREWAVMGRALGRITEPGESMSLGGIGAVGYYSGLEIYDVYGLVTPSVIAGAVPLEKSSPGHDIRVPTTFFLDRHPTYAGAGLIRASEPTESALPGNWSVNPLARLVKIERYPLIEADGAPRPGWEVFLLRYTRWE